MTLPGINLALLLSTAAAQRQLQNDLTNAARRAGGQASNAFDSAFRPRNIAASALPFALTAAAERSFTTIINSAAKYEQALSATTQVFGEMSDEINEFVQNNSRGLGIAKKDTQDYLNQFGAILRGLELSTPAAAKFAVQLTKAGSALAAFRNTSVDQAINALQAGFRGEYDSLQRFIPEVSDLTLTLRAMKLGLAETRTAVTQQDKALALLDLVQNSVGRSAGEVELAHGNLQTRLAESKAQALDFATAIGRAMIPALNGALDAVNAVGPATLILSAGILLMGRRMAASAAAGTGFIANMRASYTASSALSAAIVRQQTVFAGLSVTQAIAARSAIAANNSIIASSTAALGATSGLGAAFGRLAGQMAVAATTGSAATRSFAVAAVAARGAGAALGAGLAVLGGPVTLALVAATVGIGYFMNQQAKQKEQSRAAAAANKTYAESIAEVGNSGSNAARKLAAKELLDRGITARAARAGVDLELVTRAYAGQADAVSDLNDAINTRIVNLEKELREGQKAGGLDDVRHKRITDELSALRTLNGNMAENNKALTDARNKNQLYNESLGITSAGLDHVSQAYAKGEEAINRWREAEERIYDARAARFDAQIAYQAALDDLTESIEKNGTTLDISTAKGRANVGVAQELIQAAYDQATAELEKDGVISASTQAQIDNLKNVLIQMGFNKQEVENLIGVYRRVPTEIETQIRVLGGENAEGELNAIGLAAMKMIAQYNLTPTQAFGLASGRDPRAVFGYNRATGGPVPGYTNLDRDDKTPILATPGEWVIQRPAVRRLESILGPDAMRAINDGVIPLPAQFATGGRVVKEDLDVRSWQSWAALMAKAKKLQEEKKASLEVPTPGGPGGGPGGGSLGGSAGMMRILRAQFPGLPLWSGYRPGSITLSGKRSYHASDRAVDVPPRQDVAAWIHGNYGTATRELITPYQQYNLHNGRPHTYTGAVWNQHNFAGGNAHVHWAYDRGGMYRGGVGGGILNPGDVLPGRNYTSQPEAVLDAEDTRRFQALAGGNVPIRLDEYTIGRIGQILSQRPVVIQVDGREIARTIMDRGLI